MIGFGIICMGSFIYSYVQKNKYANVSVTSSGNDFTRFKEQIFKKMIGFINPNFEYVKNSYIGLPEIMDTGMFTKKSYAISGNDLIVGKHKGVPFQYSDVKLEHTANFSDERSSPDEVFSGQVFVAKFNKNFTTPLYVYPKSSLKGYFTNNSIHDFLEKWMPKVKLEDPEFTKNFDVYCNDEVMARYILSTSLMQRIKDLSVQQKKSQLFLCFYSNKVAVLNNTQQDKFETGMFTSIKPALLNSFYADLYKQFNIIEELKLNINIWQPAGNQTTQNA